MADPSIRHAQVETLKLIVRAEMLLADLEIHMQDVEAFIEERRLADARRQLDPGDFDAE